MTPLCPLCKIQLYGGMTLVRHLSDSHGLSTRAANLIVDELYAMKIKMAPSEASVLTVKFEPLTAKQCEDLKEKVRDKEKEYEWGTYGPKRDESLQKYTIDKLSSQHLENILITQPQIDNELAAAILMLLKKRYGVL